MKAVNAPAEAQAGGPTAPASNNLDPLNSIDVSSLDRLIAIRQEQDKINGFRAKAKEKKTAVAEAVFKRVMDDYASRSSALEAQSAPLRAQARGEYKKLRAVINDVGARSTQARMAKDELEFRSAIGELSDADLGDKMRDPHTVLAQCEAEQKQIDAIRARFVEAFGSEDLLDTDDEPPTREAQPVRIEDPPTAPPSPSLRMAAAFVHAKQKYTPPPPAPPPPPADDDLEGATIVVPRTAVRMAEPPPQAAEDDDEDNAATMMLQMAAIVLIEPASASQEFQLASVNSIGRSDENQICLLHAGISRKHAVIKAIPNGFSIKDLGSQNGTFVNGQRVTEKALTDGDTLAIGSVRFIFRMPWQPSGGNTRPGKR